jgi:glutathione peroxidase
MNALGGGPANLDAYRGSVVLIVNVASQCGLTPQYAGLQQIADTYAERGLVVLGVPCNQFGLQEPGTDAEIAEFCSVNYGVTFPITEKVDVNGPTRHPLYDLLVGTADVTGHSGDIRWNFEKFLIGRDGAVITRFNPAVTPADPMISEAIEKALA